MEPQSSLPCLQEPATGCSLIQLNPAHTLTLSFFKIRYDIILPPMPLSLKWSLLFRFSEQNFVMYSFSRSFYTPRPPRPPPLDHPNNMQ